MSSKGKLILIATVAAIGLAAAPALYAHDSRGSSGSMMGSGMMGQGGMMSGGMMGMMNMMSNMMSGRGRGEMAQGCSQMMQGMQGGGSQRPNEQWRPNQTPDKDN
jgi:hypothetical protein